jgi:molybdopterin-biosynthesis enzyme MoeA-like protein
VAKAFGVSIDVDPRAVAIMEPAYAKRGIEFNDARRRMARIPAGADLITNAVSMAPGFRLGNVIVMAGVPAIMEAMLKVATQDLRTGPPVVSVTIPVAHAEGEIAEIFAAHQRRWPSVAMGSYPQMKDGRYSTELVLRSTAADDVQRAALELRADLTARGLILSS